MRLPVIAALLAVSAGPALSECLDAADLGRGIVVTYVNGDVTTMRRVSDGTVQVDETYADGTQPMRFRAQRGIYFLEEHGVLPDGAPVPGTRLEIAFAQDPETLPLPADGIAWTGETTNIFENGTQRAETMSIAFTAAPPVLLSGCAYQTLDTDLRYDWGADGGITLEYLYLTELGVGIVISNHFDGGERLEAFPASLALAGK